MPETPHLSTKPIPPRERLIVALDVESAEEALDLVEQLGDAACFYKLGLELFTAGNYFELAATLVELDKKVFVDLKFFDVPETVARAVRRLKQHNVTFVTVHGNTEMVRAASAEKNGTKVLAVTVLTSLDRDDLLDLGYPPEIDVADLVLSRARRAIAANADGVISSGLEAAALRDELGSAFLIVSPGIRPFDNALVPSDDQKRVVDVETAFLNGADYIVVGRPIRNAEDPRRAALDIQERIARLFAEDTTSSR